MHNIMYEKLFSAYCDPILQKAECFHESSLRNLFDSLDLEESLHDKLPDALAELYCQWSLDAFAVGLHLGLSLRGDVRHGGPQQVQ